MSGEIIPKKFGLSSLQLRDLDSDTRSFVATAVAGVVRRNMSIEISVERAAWASGSGSVDFFRYVAAEWTELLIKHCFLAEDSTILDIGCGAGRMAFGMSAYLGDNGSYTGFDPLEDQIAFANEAINRPNFSFQHVDLWHRLYRPGGKINPDSFRFPTADASVDVAVSASVITHLERETAQRHLDETARVLRHGGRALYSTFIITPDMLPENGAVTRLFGDNHILHAARNEHFEWRFAARGDGFYTHSDEAGAPKNHYMADPLGDPMAYEIATFTRMVEQAGLRVVEFLPGAWCREHYIDSYQDVFVLERP